MDNYFLNLAPPVRSKIPLVARLAGSIGAVALCTWVAFRFGLNVPTVGLLYLVLVVLVSLHGGFAVATVTSIVAAVCLDYFFHSSDPQFRGEFPAILDSMGNFRVHGAGDDTLGVCCQPESGGSESRSGVILNGCMKLPAASCCLTDRKSRARCWRH